MNKMIVVVYLDVRDIPREEVGYHCQSTLKTIKHRDIVHYVIPSYDATRVDCINPKVISEYEYTTIKNTLEECTKKVEAFLESVK